MCLAGRKLVFKKKTKPRTFLKSEVLRRKNLTSNLRDNQSATLVKMLIAVRYDNLKSLLFKIILFRLIDCFRNWRPVKTHLVRKSLCQSLAMF